MWLLAPTLDRPKFYDLQAILKAPFVECGLRLASDEIKAAGRNCSMGSCESLTTIRSRAAKRCVAGAGLDRLARTNKAPRPTPRGGTATKIPAAAEPGGAEKAGHPHFVAISRHQRAHHCPA